VEGSRRAHAEDLPAEARAFERETERSADEPHADDADRRERRCCGHDQRPPRRAARRARTLYRASARGIEGGVAALAGMQGAETEVVNGDGDRVTETESQSQSQRQR